jgi:competence protein ComGC
MKANSQHGLTLVEVLVVTAVVIILFILLVPRMVVRRQRPQRISCVNNLKQVGLTARLYANDHNDEFPWKVPIASTGSLEFAESPQVFHHFAVMSNELITPKILGCKSDPARRPVAEFKDFSNTNLSYFVGLDAREDNPQFVLFGDRNITGGTFTNGFLRRLKTNDTVGWTSELHNSAGNISLSDGSVQQVTTLGLQNQLQMQPQPVIRLAVP